MIVPTSITYGEIIYPPGGAFGPRRQHPYQLVFVYRGSMTAWLNGVPIQAGAHTTTMVLPAPEARFEFAKQGETHHAWVHIFLPELARPIKERLKRLAPVIPLSPLMDELMQSLLRLRTATLPTLDEVIKAIALQMFWLYIGEAEQYSTQDAYKMRSPLVEQAQHYINVHLHEAITLEQIATAVAISPAHLIRLFRQQSGQTPLAYVWQQRVNMGIELLAQTGLTVEQIAHHCGFKTSYHFSRRVKEATGFTPTQIRQQG
ncbi:MAG: helix-turn-helix transcriptional regulator [Caldilineaceae bacterium]|nr:helix-turn-helix transcriptional regulator [Caldilineaceae bacterium]